MLLNSDIFKLILLVGVCWFPKHYFVIGFNCNSHNHKMKCKLSLGRYVFVSNESLGLLCLHQYLYLIPWKRLIVGWLTGMASSPKGNCFCWIWLSSNLGGWGVSCLFKRVRKTHILCFHCQLQMVERIGVETGLVEVHHMDCKNFEILHQ